MKYTPTQYARALYDLLDANPKETEKILKAFAQKLLAQGSAHQLRAIGSAFSREWYARHKVTPVEVTTAETGLFSKKELEKTLGKEIDLIEKKDPNVVAGARIKIGDYQIDNTLARRLSDLKNALTQ